MGNISPHIDIDEAFDHTMTRNFSILRTKASKPVLATRLLDLVYSDFLHRRPLASRRP